MNDGILGSDPCGSCQRCARLITLPSLSFFAPDAADSDDVRSEKNSIFLVAASCCFFGLIWTGMYLVVFGVGLTAALPLGFAVIVGSALIASHITRDHRIAVYVQIVCIIYIPTFIQWSTGGAFDAGFVMAWAFLGPLIALMFFSVPRAAIWQGLFLVNVVITVAFNDTFASNAQPVSDGQRLFFLAMNLGMASVVVFVFAAYFVRNALNEKRKADNLLRNILPDKIARTLKSRDGVIAEEFGMRAFFSPTSSITQTTPATSPPPSLSLSSTTYFIALMNWLTSMASRRSRRSAMRIWLSEGFPSHMPITNGRWPKWQ